MPIKALGILTLLIAMSVESVAQIFLKVGAAGGSRVLLSPYGRLAQKSGLSSASSWIVLGIFLYAMEVFLYTLVLHWLDVSIAFPMGSLCFVGVALLSKIFLGEVVDRWRWTGILCIVAGTLFVAL